MVSWRELNDLHDDLANVSSVGSVPSIHKSCATYNTKTAHAGSTVNYQYDLYDLSDVDYLDRDLSYVDDLDRYLFECGNVFFALRYNTQDPPPPPVRISWRRYSSGTRGGMHNEHGCFEKKTLDEIFSDLSRSR